MDALAFGEEDVQRLIVASGGNIREPVKPADYLTRNDTTPIEGPAQAWNVLTVGAYTEKITITDQDYAGWTAFAPAGDLMPTEPDFGELELGLAIKARCCPGGW